MSGKPITQMMKTYLLLTICVFFGCEAAAQSKDSISFFKKHHDVPVKYKLEHFGLRGKVQSFYEITVPENEDNEKIIHEFDTNGNLLQIKNSFGIIIQKFNYDTNGKLLSYTTKSKSMRDFQVTLNSDGNVAQMVINNQEHGVSTISNEFNSKGIWIKQIRLEDKNVLQENVFEKDTKLVKVLVYNNNKISETTTFTYFFTPDFVQIQLVSTYEGSEEVGISYIYVDYYGNDIYGFPFDNGTLNETQIKEVLHNFKIDTNNNWIKNQEVERVITYY